MLNVVVSSVLLIIGIAVVIYASTFPDFSLLTRVGPDLFPSIMGWVIIICSAIVLFQALRKLASKRDSDGKIDLGEEKEKFRAALAKIKERKKNFIAMVGIPVMMLLYGLLIETVGFEILSVLFLFISILLCGERRPLRLVLIPVISTACMYLVFIVLLKIPMHCLFL